MRALASLRQTAFCYNCRMQFLDLTLATPAENLALDEALLDEADLGPGPRETLRLWEPTQTMVVIGRSSQVAQEVNASRCRQESVPILRRASGGAAIVTGPGCLMYAVILSYELRPHLRMLDQAHRFVLERIKAAVEPFCGTVQLCGTSDLALAGRKVSGNSLRCKRDHFLYHGTLLLNFPLNRVEELLSLPPRQPEYRKGRSHAEFLANLDVRSGPLRSALVAAWQAEVTRTDWPRAALRALVAQRYASDDWNL